MHAAVSVCTYIPVLIKYLCIDEDDDRNVCGITLSQLCEEMK